MGYVKNDIVSSEDFDAIRKLRRLKRNLILAVVIALAFACTVVIICFQGSKISKMDQRIEELTNQPSIAEPVTPKITLDVITTEIKEIGELASMEYLYTNAGKFSDSRQIKSWNVPFTEKSFVIKWDGTIKAGIDIERLYTKVDEWNKVLTVCMPKAEILSHDIHNDAVEMLDESNGLFNNISVEDKICLLYTSPSPRD